MLFYKHLTGVLTAQACQAIIDRGLNEGFDEAPINMGDGTQVMLKHIRNNTRVLFHDQELAAELTPGILSEIPKQIHDVDFVRLGSFFRLYKYVPGQYFKRHRDGSFEDTDSTSAITVLFYLNDTDGGETILMPFGNTQPDTFVSISPKQGDVLMFEHWFWHEGREVNSGEKYVLRSDIFYTKSQDD